MELENSYNYLHILKVYRIYVSHTYPKSHPNYTSLNIEHMGASTSKWTAPNPYLVLSGSDSKLCTKFKFCEDKDHRHLKLLHDCGTWLNRQVTQYNTWLGMIIDDDKMWPWQVEWVQNLYNGGDHIEWVTYMQMKLLLLVSCQHLPKWS